MLSIFYIQLIAKLYRLIIPLVFTFRVLQEWYNVWIRQTNISEFCLLIRFLLHRKIAYMKVNILTETRSITFSSSRGCGGCGHCS